MDHRRSKKLENAVYAGLWMLVAAAYLLAEMRDRAQLSGMPLLDTAMLVRMARVMLPFVLLFFVNNSLLIPRLLLRNRYKAYFPAVAIAIMAVWAFQYHMFAQAMEAAPRGHFPRPPHHGAFMRPLLPLPVFLDFLYALLLVGANIAVALIFRRYDDRLEHERLMKTNAEHQLAYLKAQINPHFYMNMLNNIHGMIEIDPVVAQSMVIDMSQLMRYMLYDSSREAIPLADEIAFLQNYLRLMRQRFPADRVSITATFPDAKAAAGITLPPLLFLVFIENAFKHGVSYRSDSFVAVRVAVASGTVHFSCMNSCHSAAAAEPSSHGIGLSNVRRRLELIYGAKAALHIDSTPETYTVNLTIPLNETTHSDN